MKLEGQFTLNAPIQQVWDTLHNPAVMAACVPGCEQLEAVDEKTYKSIVAAKVGSVSARFKFTTKLTEVDPPTHLKATGSGEEMSKMATFTQETVVNLEELSDHEVQVSYLANVSIVGKLATFGDRIMKAKAAQVQEQFTQALEKRLSESSTVEEEPEEEPEGEAEEEPEGEVEEEPEGEAEEKPARESKEEPKAKAKAEPKDEAKAKPKDEAKAKPKAKAKATPKKKAKAKPKAKAKEVTTAMTPALKVTFWELIVAFFSVLWEKITRLFKGSRK